MKTCHLVIAIEAAMLCLAPANGQITVAITELPHVTNDYHRAYRGTSVNVAGLLGGTNGPQTWDFSQPQQPGEIIKRMDIVPPSDGGYGPSFPQATYAKRFTFEASGNVSREYYSLATNQGRSYHGFVDTNSNPSYPLKVFSAPTVDLPDPVQFGQTWTRTVNFEDWIDFPFEIRFAVHFTAQASVDAYGDLTLPNIGTVPALRVNEVHTYQNTDMSYGLFHSTTYFRNYYWLVPGIGKAVDILSDGSSTRPPGPNLTTAKEVLRVFEASGAGSTTLTPVTNLLIHLEGGSAVLDWQAATNSSGYQVEAAGLLNTGNWQVTATPTTNSWSETLTPTQRFYRVFWKP